MSKPLLPLQQIFNAASVTLDQNPGTLPNMLTALLEMFQQMSFEKVTKSIVNFNVVEVTSPLNFFGVMMPVTPYRKLMMEKDGQRTQFQWFDLFALPTLELTPDDCISWMGVQYRVMGKENYTQYGYVSYLLQTDFSGSGPTGGV